MKPKRENEDFNRIQANLKASGYKEKNVIISSRKAMILGIIYAIPFITILGLLYRFMLMSCPTNGQLHFENLT